MTFVILFVVLLIERFFDWSHLRNWNGYLRIAAHLLVLMPKQSPFLILAILLIPLLLLLLLLDMLLSHVFYGIFHFLFQIIVLLYCFGPPNLWSDSYKFVEIAKSEDPNEISQQLKLLFGVTTHSKSLLVVRKKFASQFFIESNERIFAPIFYYLFLGVVGAALYRVIKLFANQPSTLSNSARAVAALLDWLPTRVLTFLFALGGHFMQVFQIWRTYLPLGVASNERLLVECGFAAIEADKADTKKNIERNAIHLFDRGLIILLVLIGIWSGSILF